MRGIRLAVGVAISVLSALPSATLAQTDPSSSGSIAFCLFELPPDGEKRVWMNLSFVQYIEMRPTELRIYYGGGSFGSGYEQRIPLTGKDDGLAFVKRMQIAAASCRGTASRAP